MSINGKIIHEIPELEFFLTVIWILQSEFLLGVWQMIFMYAKKYEKTAKHISYLIKEIQNQICAVSHSAKVLQLAQQHEVLKFQNSLVYYAIHETFVKMFL